MYLEQKNRIFGAGLFNWRERVTCQEYNIFVKKGMSFLVCFCLFICSNSHSEREREFFTNCKGFPYLHLQLQLKLFPPQPPLPNKNTSSFLSFFHKFPCGVVPPWVRFLARELFFSSILWNYTLHAAGGGAELVLFFWGHYLFFCFSPCICLCGITKLFKIFSKTISKVSCTGIIFFCSFWGCSPMLNVPATASGGPKG